MGIIDALSSAGLPEKECRRILNVAEEELKPELENNVKDKPIAEGVSYGKEQQIDQLIKGNSKAEPEREHSKSVQ